MIYYLSCDMLIEEKKLKHWIDHFYGYGTWQAKIWFIGYEEGGGEFPEEVADKINYFYNTHPSHHASLCDIRALYQNVAMYDGPKTHHFTNRFQYRFDQHAVLHGTWKNLFAFAHGYRGKKLPDLLAYQKQHFLSATLQQETLIQFYPLPSPHNHAWYYSWVDLPGLSFIRNRNGYQEHVYADRVNTILSNIKQHKPELVLMYGMNNINTLKKSVQDFFYDAAFKQIKGIKQQIPQHHRADFNGTTLLITTQMPNLRHGRIETGFEWEEFGRKVAEK